MVAPTYADPDARRLAACLRWHQDQLFTILDRPEADWNYTLAERPIPPGVTLRKNSLCNRSQRGAATQAVLMCVYRTLKLRVHDPRAAIGDALPGFAATGALPPLPSHPWQTPEESRWRNARSAPPLTASERFRPAPSRLLARSL